jgi:hypothetical protein
VTKTRIVADRLRRLGACDDALEWAAAYASPKKAWAECPRGDWMLWLLGKVIGAACGPWSDGRKPLVDCALDCALTVEHLWPNKRKQQIEDAVGAVRRWVRGEATTEEAKTAQRSLSKVAAATAATAADAATAAATAATAAATATAADATATAADAAYAAYAAATTAYADAQTKSLQESADIVRRHFPNPPEVKTT